MRAEIAGADAMTMRRLPDERGRGWGWGWGGGRERRGGAGQWTRRWGRGLII